MQERFEDWQPPIIEHGKPTRWNWLVQHPNNLILGKCTDIGAFTYINALHGVEIQDEAQIASHCSVYSLSTIDNKKGKVTIKKNARVGTHSTIMPGITIGENAVIGAHSFVNKDVPADTIAYGTPIKVHKKQESTTKTVDSLIPLAKPNICANDITNVVSVLNSRHLSLGPYLSKFEHNFSQLIGTKYAVGVNSGTSGLHLIIRALGIKQGDEVITSSFSFIASSNCILYEKAKPVFVDVQEDTFNIDPTLIEQAITPKTKALLIPHIFGQTCDMTRIMEIAKRHNLFVIEDACESILATHQGRLAGTFGDAAVFAFYPNKQMTTGEGGMILTNNTKIHAYCKSAANQGRSDNLQWLTHDKLGFNYRLDEMSAALGVSQLEKIYEMINKRKQIAKYYTQQLNSLPQIKTPHVQQGNDSSWFVYAIKVPSVHRDQLIKHLRENQIQSKAYFSPAIHMQPFYISEHGYKQGDFPTTESLSNQTLVLPFYTELTTKQIDRVCDTIKTYFN